jgi:hypothetical protein
MKMAIFGHSTHSIFRYFLHYFSRLSRTNFSQISQDLSLSCDPVGFAIFAIHVFVLTRERVPALRRLSTASLSGVVRCLHTNAYFSLVLRYFSSKGMLSRFNRVVCDHFTAVGQTKTARRNLSQRDICQIV